MILFMQLPANILPLTLHDFLTSKKCSQMYVFNKNISLESMNNNFTQLFP